MDSKSRTAAFTKTRKFQFFHSEHEIIGNMNCQHYHDGFEIYLHTEGERRVIFNNRVYNLVPGSMFVIEPFVLHRTINAENAVCGRRIVNFKTEILSTFLTRREIDNLYSRLKSSIMLFEDESYERIISHFDEIARQWKHYRHDGIKRAEKLAYIEIYRLIDSILYLGERLPEIVNINEAERAESPEILQVLQYIENHYSEEISLDDMVKYSHMSKSGFYRAFAKVTGDTFANYLTGYRLSCAHKLITETDKPFYEIAMSTGFSSTAHLSRVFRSVYGMSPSAFRKNENI